MTAKRLAPCGGADDPRGAILVPACSVALSGLFLLALTQVAAGQSAADFRTEEYRANWGLEMVNAAEAYAQGYTGAGVTVGVIDTGLQTSNPEFKGAVSDLSRNFEKDRTDSSDVEPGKQKTEKSDDDPYDSTGHGTHVAGIIGARRDGKNFHGVAFDAKIASLRAIGPCDPGKAAQKACSGDLDAANRALGYAAEQHLGVVNGSYGPATWVSKQITNDKGQEVDNPAYEELSYQPVSDLNLVAEVKALRKAAAADVLMVFAASNDATDQPGGYSANPAGAGAIPYFTGKTLTTGGDYRLVDFPTDGKSNFNSEDPKTWKFYSPDDPDMAKVDFTDLQGSLITVVGLGPDGKIAKEYSNRCGVAAAWCVAAPGGETHTEDGQLHIDKTGIISAWPVDKFKWDEGTSMATPHVAGVAALVRQAFPYMTARQAIGTILTTAKPIGDPKIYGRGLVDAGKAVRGPGALEFDYDVNTQGASSEWSNDITGTGALVKRGGGTLTLSGTNAYSGGTTVRGGILDVEGKIGAVTVRSDGALTGSGSVGALTAAGGVVSPGAVGEVGTMRAAQLAQQKGSVLLVDVEEDKADRLEVAGSAVIASGARLAFTGGDATLTPGTDYTVLTADGGISGRYVLDDTQRLSAFLAPEQVVTTSSLAVGILQDRPFAAAAATDNQTAVAIAADGLDTTDPVHAALVNLDTDAAARAAFDGLSGQSIASTQAALIEDSAFLAQGILRRASGATASAALAPGSRLSMWMDGQTQRLHAAGTGNTATTNFDSDGLRLGIDGAFDGYRLGAALGYDNGTLHTPDLDSSAEVDGLHFGLYGLAEMAGWNFTGGWTYSRYDVDSRRSVAFDGIDEKLTGSQKDQVQRLFAEAARPVDLGTTKLEPFVGLSQSWMSADGFSESGGDAALSVDKEKLSLTTTRLGARGTWELGTGSQTVTAQLGGAWEANFGDRQSSITASFADGDSFETEGIELPKNLAAVEASLGFAPMPNGWVRVGYGGRFGEHFEDYAGLVNLEIRF